MDSPLLPNVGESGKKCLGECGERRINFYIE